MYRKFFLNDFRLPIYIEKDCDYFTQLKRILNEYKDIINASNELPEDVRKEVKENCDNLCECIKYYYNAEIIKAQDIISEIINKYTDNNHPFIVSDLKNSYSIKASAPPLIRSTIHNNSNLKYEEMMETENFFYRARVSEKKLNKKEIFHIPFNKRSIITTQRFSIPGVPCLYLATTSFGAWIELDMPSPKLFQVSEYKIPENLKVLNLCIQQHLINGKSSFISDDLELTAFHDLIIIFPLIIASSFCVLEQNRKFKSEYIISQLIMQSAKSCGIDIVAYLSKKIDDFTAYPQAVNLALLINQENLEDESVYWNNSKNILLTEPELFSNFLENHYKGNNTSKNLFINKFFGENYSGKIRLMGKEFNYIETAFSQFDEWLNKKEKSAIQ